MSKVFDEEYRRLAENDIPDLWNRIEAGLNMQPINAVPDTQPINAVPDTQPINAAPDARPTGAISHIETDPTRRNRGIPLRTIRKYAGIVAACICAAIIIPAAVNRGKLTDMSAMPSAEDADAAAPEEIAYEAAEAELAPTETAPEEDASAAAEYAPAAEAAPEEAVAEAEPDYTSDTGGLSDGEMPSERSDTAGQTIDEIKDEITADEGMPAELETENQFDGIAENNSLTPKDKEDYQGMLADGQIVKGVSITVIATDTTESATVYYAVIREDSDQLFTQGEMITFIKTAAVAEEINVGEYYQVNLRYDEEAVHFEADAVKLMP